jgi:two-component system cell cycle response regulator
VSEALDAAARSLVEPIEPRPPAPPQRSTTTGFAVLAVFGYVALAVVYLEAAQTHGLTNVIVTELAFLVPIAVSALLCMVAYRRANGAERRFWLLASGLNAILLVSELYYVWWVLYYGSPPPGIYLPFQLLAVAAAGFFYLVLAAMTGARESRLMDRLRWRLDLVSAAVVVYVIALEGWVVHVLAGLPGVTSTSLLVAAVYPSWGVLMVLGMLWALLGPVAVKRPWERLLAVSMIIYACGIIAWPIWYASFLRAPVFAEDRNVLDLILAAGLYLFTIAAAMRLARSGQAWPLRGAGRARRLPSRTVAYAAVTLNLVALPAFVVLFVLSPAGTLARWAYGAAAGIVCVLMIARTVVAAVENGQLFHRSVTDPLTGLFSHRYFFERLATDMDVVARYDEPLAVLSLDLDDFEAVNRTFGHPAGDELLRGVGAALRAACRASDVVCRIGADEFAVILPRADAAGALHTALRVQEQLRRLDVAGSAAPTASIGIACFPAHASDADTLLHLAEGATYWAKQHGKDQVLLYDPDTVSEMSPQDRIRTIERRTQLGTVRALAAAVDSRFAGRRSRGSVVPGLAASLARRLGLAEERVRLIETAAVLRDVGMIAVGDDVLTKAGPLDEREWEQVRRHAGLGAEIVGATIPDIALAWIRHHHERWDGRGYPDRLRAVAIPLEARILAVCDAWGAMTSERPFAPALAIDDAANELRATAGTQFDPSVVEVFLDSLGVTGADEG